MVESNVIYCLFIFMKWKSLFYYFDQIPAHDHKYLRILWDGCVFYGQIEEWVRITRFENKITSSLGVSEFVCDRTQAESNVTIYSLQ